MSTWRKKRSVMRKYNLTAQMYDERYCEEQEAKYTVALEGSNMTQSSVILDVGCGSGLFFNHLLSKKVICVGVDVSRQLLLIAKNRVENLPSSHLVLADADYLPFREAVFSHVFAFTVLQNMPSPLQTLREVRLVAKRDAYFVVTGLKAAISVETFSGFLEKTGLQLTSFRDDDALRCYVATAVQRRN